MTSHLLPLYLSIYTWIHMFLKSQQSYLEIFFYLGNKIKTFLCQLFSSTWVIKKILIQ